MKIEKLIAKVDAVIAKIERQRADKITKAEERRLQKAEHKRGSEKWHGHDEAMESLLFDARMLNGDLREWKKWRRKIPAAFERGAWHDLAILEAEVIEQQHDTW